MEMEREREGKGVGRHEVTLAGCVDAVTEGGIHDPVGNYQQKIGCSDVRLRGKRQQKPRTICR